MRTNADGLYIVLSLLPSEYDIRVNAPGFSEAETRHVALSVGQEVNHDFAVKPAGTQTVVTIDAGSTVALDTASAKIGANVASREIEDLPINGRQISQLYLLVPGATNAGSGTFDNIRFSGRAVEQNIIRLDGIEATSIIDTSPGNLNGELTSIFRLQQSLESVQEFRIDSSSYPAEMGTGTGGQVSFITKSGTNNFHGSVFEYLRNDFFDARNSFNRRSDNHARRQSQVPFESVRRLHRRSHHQGQALRVCQLRGSAPDLGGPAACGDIQQLRQIAIPTSSAVYPLLAAFPADPFPLTARSPSANRDHRRNQ